MSKPQDTPEPASEPVTRADKPQPDKPQPDRLPAEHGGPPGPEPTRYGDWEKNGRCTDF